MGNQLWQYAVGRIISQRLGYKFNSPGISGLSDCPAKIKGKRVFFPKLELHGHYLPENFNGKRIVLKGYFERYEYVQPHMDQIEKWFKSAVEIPRSDEGALTVSIRRGSNNWPVDSLCPSESYYLEKIENLGFKKHYICTDSPDDSFITELARKIRNAKIVRADVLTQFAFLQNSRHIMIAPSTFSWWAAMTGKAETIYWPNIPALTFHDSDQDWFPSDSLRVQII